MYYYHYPWGWSFFGMNFLWWLFWLALLVAFFSMVRPVPRRGRNQLAERNRAFEILQRRYAAGELSTADYEERKGRLLRDQAELRDKAELRDQTPRTTTTTTTRDLPPGDPLPQH